MGDRSKIEWTDATWNPLVGCSRVSAGCENCYAERTVHRGLSVQHRGLTRSTSRGPVWTGEVRLVPEALELPLRWRKPRRIFVNSLSDLFHESVPDETIDQVLAVVALSPRHTYQVLTKRAERAREYVLGLANDPTGRLTRAAAYMGVDDDGLCFLSNWLYGWSRPQSIPDDGNPCNGTVRRWPLPNLHLGVSCENQDAADERVWRLLQTPAAVRWVSAEPLLGAIDFGEVALRGRFDRCPEDRGIDTTAPRNPMAEGEDCEGCPGYGRDCAALRGPRLDWIVVGGESGPGARRCDVAWIRSIVEQCDAARVPVFVKQLGARPFTDHRTRPDGEASYWTGLLQSRKGSDPSEWPEDLRRRELPEARA